MVDILTKCLSEWQTGKILSRLLPQKESDLGLHRLPRPFCKAISVRNFRTSILKVLSSEKSELIISETHFWRLFWRVYTQFNLEMHAQKHIFFKDNFMKLFYLV